MQRVDTMQPDRRKPRVRRRNRWRRRRCRRAARRAKGWQACRADRPSEHAVSPALSMKMSADGEHRGKANGQRGERFFAEIEEFDRQHAQAQRHVDRQRDDDAEFGKHDQRLARQRQEIVERIGAVERGRQREKVQRQENRQRDAGQAVQHRRDEAALSGARRASCGVHGEHGAQAEDQEENRKQRQARDRASVRAMASIRARRCAGRSARGSRPR